MSEMGNTVFISYRRTISSFIARAIYMDLKAHDFDVFMDVESVDSGEFDPIILRQIEARTHFLIICSHGTFEGSDEPEDWLRREIEHALDTGRNIVPILVNGFTFEMAKERLRGKLLQLTHYNGLLISHDYFKEAMERLRTRFLKVPVNTSVIVPPESDIKKIEAKQATIESQPLPTPQQLSAEQYANRADEHLDKQDWEKAIVDYSEAIRLNPHYAHAYYGRGIAFSNSSDLQCAIEDINDAIRLAPNHICLS